MCRAREASRGFLSDSSPRSLCSNGMVATKQTMREKMMYDEYDCKYSSTKLSL